MLTIKSIAENLSETIYQADEVNYTPASEESTSIVSFYHLTKNHGEVFTRLTGEDSPYKVYVMNDQGKTISTYYL